MAGMRLPNRRAWAILLLLSMLTAVVACLGVGLRLPEIGLDPSWEQALVEATDHGRVFGRDLVFTYGPLHQAATQQISTNPVPLLTGRILFSLAWLAACMLVGLWRGNTAAFLFTLLVGVLNSRTLWIQGRADVLFISLAICGILLSVGQLGQSSQRGFLQRCLLLMLAVGIGLSPLVKLSFLGVAAPSLAVMTAIAAIADPSRPWAARARGILLMALAPPLALTATWWGIGAGTVRELWAYFTGPNLSVIQGYTEAMAISPGTVRGSLEILLYFLCSVLGGIACWATVLQPAAHRMATSFRMEAVACLIPATGLATIWLVVFKASFIRQDIHTLTAGLTTLSFASVVALLGWQEVTRKTMPNGWNRVRITTLLATAGLGGGLTAWFSGWNPLAENTTMANLRHFDMTSRLLFTPLGHARMARMRKERLKALSPYTEDFRIANPSQMRADILPWSITDLLSQGLLYQPRPIPQSYSAYRRNLQELNARYFLSGPDVVIVQVKEIDGRLPAGLDGGALQQILSSYRVSHNGAMGSLVFSRCGKDSLPCGRPALRRSVHSGTLYWQHDPKLGYSSSPIDLHQAQRESGTELWLDLNLTPSIPRRLSELLFRSPPVWIDYLNERGDVQVYARVIPSASHKLLVSPLLRSSQDLSLMLQPTNPRKTNGQETSLGSGSKPAALRLRTQGLGAPFISSSYRLELIKR